VECIKCGEEFSGRSNRKYCSKQCQSRAKASRRYWRNIEKESFKLFCPQCGKEFAGTRKTQIFCSVKCNG